MLAVQNYNYNMFTFIDSMVSITRFNKGEAGKIIDEVKNYGPRIIVKNNVPECVLISMKDYQRLNDAANRTATLDTSKEAETKRKELIKKIRANVQPPLPPTMSVEEALSRYGTQPIQIDEDAITELRRISTL